MEFQRTFEGLNGAKFFIYENHLYQLKNNRKYSKYFVCNYENCKATVTINNACEIIWKRGDHLHLPNSAKIASIMCIDQMKSRAIAEPTVPLLQIYRQELSKKFYGHDVCYFLPKFETIKSALFRLRSTILPKLPDSIENIILPEEWRQTFDGRNFLIADDGIGKERIIIFGTKENLNILSSSENVAMDGTFKIQPRYFTQLYTVHGKYKNNFFPLVYALLPSKSQQHYERMLTLIKEAAERDGTALNFPMALCDFEIAAINAIETVFPDVMVKGCYFYFTQSIIRKVQTLGLKVLYETEEEFRKWIRRTAVLPLVPPNLVEDAFLLLAEDAPQHPKTMDFHNYIVDTYLKEDYFFREKSMFPIALWNHFHNAQERTTNNVEGWHSKMNRKANHRHLNIFSFILLIKEEQKENEAIMRMLDVGHSCRRKTKKYVLINERLTNLKQQFSNGEMSLINYMDAVSHLIHLQ